jgi:hypothetical protein
MSIVEKSAQPAQAPPKSEPGSVYGLLGRLDMQVTLLRSEVAALREMLAPIALYAPRDPEAHLPAECRAHTCGYYSQYLAYGGPDLTHEGYHAAEKLAEHHFASCWSIRHDRGPCQVCISHEQRLRA